MSNELKPCPFCGSAPEGPSFCQEVGAMDTYEVECAVCCFALEGPAMRIEAAARLAAIDHWNTRA